ncbi:hypothetical protein ES705_36602 [subsurface metagenome]
MGRILSVITRTAFIDIRPFKRDLKDLMVTKSDILNMPFEENAAKSQSCLHVVESILD